jgi:MSHA biogenesis protein MshO
MNEKMTTAQAPVLVSGQSPERQNHQSPYPVPCTLKPEKGFTLIELVMVIIITGLIAAALMTFLVPALKSYFDTRRRGDLTDMADTALRRMAQDIRSAVPNSIRTTDPTCFQLVPTLTGGRYRLAEDVLSGGNSRALDTSTATTAPFDVLSRMRTLPSAGDWVVIDNQNGDDVYASTGGNRGQIASVQTPPGPGGTAVGQHRITLAGAPQFPTGYVGGRFIVVADNEQTVTYTCNGDKLYRVVADFGPAACTAPTGSPIVASDVSGCTFNYTPSQGATQQSGFIELQLTLAREGDSITLAHGVHVENVP